MTSNFYTAGGAALTSLREDWRTPPDLFAALHREFNFTVDAAATPANALLPRFFTRENDAFAQDWRGERVFCNPPYGRDSGKWIALFSKWGRGGRKSSSRFSPPAPTRAPSTTTSGGSRTWRSASCGDACASAPRTTDAPCRRPPFHP